MRVTRHLDNAKKQLSASDVPTWTADVVAALTEPAVNGSRATHEPSANGRSGHLPTVVVRCDARLAARLLGDGSKRDRRSRRAGPDESSMGADVLGPPKVIAHGGPRTRTGSVAAARLTADNRMDSDPGGPNRR